MTLYIIIGAILWILVVDSNRRLSLLLAIAAAYEIYLVSYNYFILTYLIDMRLPIPSVMMEYIGCNFSQHVINSCCAIVSIFFIITGFTGMCRCNIIHTTLAIVIASGVLLLGSFTIWLVIWDEVSSKFALLFFNWFVPCYLCSDEMLHHCC